MGMRIVVRDHEGRVVAALCASISYILYPTTAEALATWKWLSMAQPWVFES